MAKPNIKGLMEARAAFKALPDIVRERMLNATEVTVREIVRGAKARLEASPSIQTRNLYNHVGWSVNKRTGRGRAGVGSGTTVVQPSQGVRVKVKGIVIPGRGGGAAGGRLDRPSRRAHLVEFGARHMEAEPFMIPAAERERQPALERYKKAGPHIERDMAAIGLRNL